MGAEREAEDPEEHDTGAPKSSLGRVLQRGKTSGTISPRIPTEGPSQKGGLIALLPGPLATPSPAAQQRIWHSAQLAGLQVGLPRYLETIPT